MNTLFPGRPDYTGPYEGWFGLLHHDRLCEESHNVMERVEYVKCTKPEHEIVCRLHNMIYLGGCDAVAKRDQLDADYRAKRDQLDADYRAKRDQLDADYEAKRDQLDADYRAKRDQIDAEILGYIRRRIPDCPWDGRELVFGS